MAELDPKSIESRDVDAFVTMLGLQLAEWQRQNPKITDGMIVCAFVRLGRGLNDLYPPGQLKDQIDAKLSKLMH